MSKPTVPLSVLSWRLAQAMSFDRDVLVTLRTRPVRTVRGRVTFRRADERRIDPAARDRSNVVVTINGEEFDVERMSAVKVMPA